MIRVLQVYNQLIAGAGVDQIKAGIEWQYSDLPLFPLPLCS